MDALRQDEFILITNYDYTLMVPVLQQALCFAFTIVNMKSI